MLLMSKIPKLGQFGHVIRRNVVATVEQRSHRSGDGAIRLWKYISLFVGAPCILLAMANCYINSLHPHKRPEPIELPYLKVMRKPFPWGDGKHSLFHNPKTNWIKGVGYEE
nr:cytochrome c oxidase subunit 6A1, mitochondrial-like [Megalopta genalis]